MDEIKRVLPYGRAPAVRTGREWTLTLTRDEKSTIVIFPGGLRSNSNVRFGLPAIIVASVALVPALIYRLPPAALLLLLIGVWGVNVWLEYDRMYRQVELEIGPEELYCISFGPKGVEERRWHRSAITRVRVYQPRSDDAQLRITANDGPETVVAYGPRDVLKDVALTLRTQLALPSTNSKGS